MNISLPGKRIHTLLLLLFTASMSFLSSCDKDADPSLIKVSSGLNAGSSGGTTGSGSGATISFTLNNKTYNLVNNTPSYYVGGTYFPAGASIPIATTTITGISPTLSGIMLTLGAFDGSGVGTYDISILTITLADGTAYSSASPSGKVKFDTFKTTGNLLSSKGSFEGYLINAADDKNPIKVTGTFNL